MGASDNTRGLVLAMLSSLFIGTSFILKKMGLKRASVASGTPAAMSLYRWYMMREPFVWETEDPRWIIIFGFFYWLTTPHMNLEDGIGGYAYLLEPLWWTGMITMIIGEAANFVAYIYAPAVIVTPLGALSIIFSAVLAHFMLKEQLRQMGVLGCGSCIVGSVVIVIHAPQEHTPNSVQEIWTLATQPAFLIYIIATISIVLALVLHFEPRYGQSNILIYLAICSLAGSLTVVSIKAIGIAIKLTLEGISQIRYPQTWVFLVVAIICVITQLNYLNKALDTFNTAIVSPIYYVMFTTLTIIASAIMFKDYSGQDASSMASELCGFITVLSGTIMLHSAREQETANGPGSITWYKSSEPVKDIEDAHFILLHNSDYF